MAGLDRLTVQARLATVLAGRLTGVELDKLVAAAMRRAEGDGAVANVAFNQLMSLAMAAIQGGDADSTEDVDWADMTPSQRAAARAEIQRRLAELAVEASERDGWA